MPHTRSSRVRLRGGQRPEPPEVQVLAGLRAAEQEERVRHGPAQTVGPPVGSVLNLVFQGLLLPLMQRVSEWKLFPSLAVRFPLMLHRSWRADRRIFTSLRGRPSSPYQAQISPFGAASALSATGGVVRHPPRFLPARSWDTGVMLRDPLMALLESIDERGGLCGGCTSECSTGGPYAVASRTGRSSGLGRR
jgi:hypothetical protein